MTQQIEVTLDTNIVSVTGLVNGEGYTFTLTGSSGGRGVWSATVPRAADDKYRISITAVNSLGTTAQLDTVIYYGLHLIYDRTIDDMDRVNYLRQKGWVNMTPAEREEWSGGMKGAYNYTDLNRVQSAVRYLRDRLVASGYPLRISEHKTWMANDVPTLTEMQNYLSDVRELRYAVTLPAGTPYVPESPHRLYFNHANDIERILAEVDRVTSDLAPHFFQSGEIYGGEY